MTNKQISAYVVELFGTFVLTMVVFMVGGVYGVLGALLIGLVMAVLVGAFLEMSGAHFNPAITAGMLALRKIKLGDALGYVVAQGLGAVAAWQLVEYFSGTDVTAVSADYSGRLLIAELIGTAVFAMAVASVSKLKQAGWQVPVTIGLGYMMGLIVASVYSLADGGSAALSGTINPAVALGMRTFSIETMVGPIVGAVVGMALYVWLADMQTKK
ncbi:aquaporin [Candidatus Saccharibacteria bacterium]|nr:aquaporin [Candidatus Saccharibacteria bacterium]MCB9821444.1 aquaporin [Candidatus Nomurabacteria bacterium]